MRDGCLGGSGLSSLNAKRPFSKIVVGLNPPLLHIQLGLLLFSQTKPSSSQGAFSLLRSPQRRRLLEAGHLEAVQIAAAHLLDRGAGLGLTKSGRSNLLFGAAEPRLLNVLPRAGVGLADSAESLEEVCQAGLGIGGNLWLLVEVQGG